MKGKLYRRENHILLALPAHCWPDFPKGHHYVYNVEAMLVENKHTLYIGVLRKEKERATGNTGS